MLELKRCELDCRCVLETPKPTLFPFQYFDDGVKIYNQQASEQSGCRTLEKIFLMFWPYFVDEQIQLPSICEDVNFGATGSHLDTKTVHLCFMWPRSLQTSIAVCRPVLVNPRPAGNPREGLRNSESEFDWKVLRRAGSAASGRSQAFMPVPVGPGPGTAIPVPVPGQGLVSGCRRRRMRPQARAGRCSRPPPAALASESAADCDSVLNRQRAPLARPRQ